MIDFDAAAQPAELYPMQSQQDQEPWQYERDENPSRLKRHTTTTAATRIARRLVGDFASILTREGRHGNSSLAQLINQETALPELLFRLERIASGNCKNPRIEAQKALNYYTGTR